MNLIDRIRLYFIKREVLSMLSNLKAKVQPYAASVVGVLTLAVMVASFFYGPVAIAGVTIPAATPHALAQAALPVVMFIVHHLAKKPSTPATPAASVPPAGQ